MVNNARKKERIQMLKKEIELKDAIIRELFTIATNNNVKVSKVLTECLNQLYFEGYNGKKEKNNIKDR